MKHPSLANPLPRARDARRADCLSSAPAPLSPQAAAHLRTGAPDAPGGGGVGRPGTPTWRYFAPGDPDGAPCRAAAAARAAERRRLAGAWDEDEEGDAGGPGGEEPRGRPASRAEARAAAPPGAWALLPDLIMLAMPDDGTSGAGPFWRGEEYDGLAQGSAEDDAASSAFQEVDALLSDWEDAADRAAAAESELRAAERLRGALVRAEDEAREQAGLSPRRGGVGGDEGEDEEAADGVQARDPLPLKARSSVRLARGRVEGAEAREGAARAAAVAAAAELRAAEAAADERVREVAAAAAEAAPPHPIGPASFAPWLLAPLAPGPRSSAAAAALRLPERLPGAPFARPDAARCYWRLWRGKWARLRERFPAEGPQGAHLIRVAAGAQQRLDLDEILGVLQVGVGRG
ncbi:hypothetical protein MNEG_15967 [Monoraphidium neglectum]|uniref:Uncharacterized protein n=1 Tax=Monoraphidium neglectum TaxID=145388 RepID=A0A0D2LPV7_9CHLO|nr:hypothetical protein MNEG_15967 [Monoraphidium neglectum]KIY91996.1 hypothetical protein MNEG_15967 [Monoraphidium neglectum]|eukprot:XP_013891016.1 hypothetical protein MNEG_15967 [Monoraphidium neglectum]